MSTEDRLAILEMTARYAHAWDARDAEAYGAVFTEDGEFEVYAGAEGPRVIHQQGRAAIRSWAREIHTGTDPGLRPREDGEQTRHFTSGTVFESLTASTARTRTMLFSTYHRPGELTPRPSVGGVYTDDWHKTAEGWRIARRSLVMDRA